MASVLLGERMWCCQTKSTDLYHFQHISAVTSTVRGSLLFIEYITIATLFQKAVAMVMYSQVLYTDKILCYIDRKILSI